MRRYILFLLLVISNCTMLNAKESIEISVHASCSDSKIEEFSIKISSNKLNLSQDALQDNTGGYVDIPEDSYYLKTDSDVYYLNGVVKNDYEKNINQFTSYVYANSERLINLEELYSLKNSKDLKFIQKIYLEDNNRINSIKKNITTNILNVHFDKNSFNKEIQRCEVQINQSRKDLYLQAALLLSFVFGILYLLKKYFRILLKMVSAAF